MTDKIKADKIAEQFSQYMEAKSSTKKANKAFSDELLEKISPKKSEESGLISKKTEKLLQPSTSVSLPRISAKPRAISNTQAKRLALYAPLIEDAARKYNVPVEIICGIMLQESGAQHKAKSHCGAMGLMQLMPGTAKRFGVKDAYNPAQNIDGGTKYLKWLLDRFNGDLELALAGYNAGEGNVEKYGNKIPPFRETQNYVPGVLAYTQKMIDIFVENKAVARISDNARRV
jgi:hypothetical protein